MFDHFKFIINFILQFSFSYVFVNANNRETAADTADITYSQFPIKWPYKQFNFYHHLLYIIVFINYEIN